MTHGRRVGGPSQDLRTGDSRTLGWGSLLVVAGLTAGVRLAATLAGGGFVTNGIYDDGVYFTAAALYVSGKWPYSDYLLLHPPGMTLALAPFAGLAAITDDVAGYTAARVAVMVVSATSAALVASYAARWGRPAAWFSGLSYALVEGSVYAGSTLFMESVATLLALVTIRRLERGGTVNTAVGGILIGLLATLKVWNAPMGLILFFFAATWRERRIAISVAAGTWMMVMAPFVARSPEAAWRMIILDQVNRPRFDLSPQSRFANFLGLASGGSSNLSVTGWPLVMTGIAAILALILVAVGLRRGVTPQVVMLLVVSALMVGMSQLALRNYAELWSPWLAIVMSASLRGWRVRDGRDLLTALFALGWLAIVAFGSARPVGKPLPVDWMILETQGTRCVVTDDPVVLVALNRLSSQLRTTCPELWADVSGRTYDYAAHEDAPREDNPVWQDAIYRYLSSADGAIRCRGNTGISTDTRERLRPALVGRNQGCDLYLFPPR